MRSVTTSITASITRSITEKATPNAGHTPRIIARALVRPSSARVDVPTAQRAWLTSPRPAVEGIFQRRTRAVLGRNGARLDIFRSVINARPILDCAW